MDNPNFTVHQVYPEQLLGRIAKKAFQTLGVKDSEFFSEMGYFFVEFVGRFGYGDVLALLGRQLRDFLNGLDNLHEYLKFSYPRLRAPSYFCDNETDAGWPAATPGLRGKACRSRIRVISPLIANVIRLTTNVEKERWNFLQLAACSLL